MDELDDDRDPEDREAIEGDDEIGPLLRRLRGDLSLRDVTRRTGISSSYLFPNRAGVAGKPGSNMIGKLAALYNVDEQELMKRAGRVGQPDPYGGEAMEIERAYQYVLADPVFRVGTRPDGPITLKNQAVHRRDVRAIRQQEAAGMNRTREDFCRLLLDDSPREALDPERLAARSCATSTSPPAPRWSR